MGGFAMTEQTFYLTVTEMWELPEPNSRRVAAITPGISRNMQPNPLAATNQGGGDLNGSANTANLLGHAGTAAQRIAVPRSNLGNYTGIV
jgi:hypothetical protein